MPITPLSKKNRIRPGDKVWVRNNADGSYHPGIFTGCPVTNDSKLTYELKDCTFRWCYAEDISTTDPGKTTTLRVKETTTLDTMPSGRLAAALERKGYTVYAQAGKIISVYRDIQVSVETTETADSLEGKLRHEFSSGLVRTLAKHNNEPMESEGIDIETPDGNTADLQEIIDNILNPQDTTA